MTTQGLSAAHEQALQKRGLDPELASRLGLWSQRSPSGGGDALVIPFLRNGEVVNRKYRTLTGEKKFWQDKGGFKCFWNEDVLRDETLTSSPVVITEGEMDAMAAIMSGYARTISVPEGAPATAIGPGDSAKYSFIEAVHDRLKVEKVTEFILAVDGDEPGVNLLHDLSIRLGRFRCKWVQYPMNRERTKRLKDLNEVLIEYGQKGVVETLQRAQWMKVDGIYKMSDLPPVPPSVGFDIGFDKLRDNYRVRLGDFAVVTGIPSMGKSSWVNDLCCRLVENHELRVAFASFEQMPQRDHRRNLRSWYLKFPEQHAKPEQLAGADAWIDEYFSFLVPSEDDDVTLEWVLTKMEAVVIQHGCRVVVIDPWNEMDHNRNQNETTTEYVNRAIKAMKRFARKFNIHLIVVAHPTKQQKDPDGKYRMPTLYDISDSAAWYNKADVGIIVHREDEHTSLVRVAKSRYHDEIGKPGEVQANFDYPKRRYEIVDTPF